MRPTQVLMQEHRTIERVLDCLERLAEEAASAGRLEREAATNVIEFIQVFADRRHHAKEEEHLFPMLVERGLPADGGPIAVMLNEHEVGRRTVGGMISFVERASEGEAEAVAGFAGHARDFVGLLRDHIAKEDHILFNMADQVLDDEAQSAVAAGFEAADASMEAGLEARLLGIADDLCQRYGISTTDPSPQGAAARPFGCGH